VADLTPAQRDALKALYRAADTRQESSRPRLTLAQRDALLVLAAHPDRELEGWKQSSTMERVPRVNMRAAHALVLLKLARPSYPLVRHSVFTHDTRYQINEAGLALARELQGEEQA
jgi:hypothetical protein